MPRSFRPSAFVPPGFHVENAVHDGGITIITVRPTSKYKRMPELRGDRGASPQPLSPALGRSAVGGSTGSACRHRAAVPMRCCFLSSRDFHGALQRRCPCAVGSPNGAAGLPRSSSRSCARRPSCRELCSPIDAAGEQRHIVESRSPARLPAIPGAYCGRDRRLGVEAQSALRHDHLRSRTTTAHPSSARQGAGDRAGVAGRSAADRHCRA